MPPLWHLHRQCAVPDDMDWKRTWTSLRSESCFFVPLHVDAVVPVVMCSPDGDKVVSFTREARNECHRLYTREKTTYML